MTTLVVLAAGLGTRFGSDKQLESVGPGGELLLEYALFDAWRAGLGRAVIVVRPDLADVFERDVAPHWQRRLDVHVAVQSITDTPRPFPHRRKPWGTAHALVAVRSHIPGGFLACNADDFYGASAYTALRAALEQGEEAVAGYPLGETLSPHGGVSRAICHTDPAGRLLRIEERTGIIQGSAGITDDGGDVFAAAVPVSMNLWAFRASFLAELEDAFDVFLRQHGSHDSAELRIPDVVNERVAAGAALRVVPVQERWFGMTYAADRAAVRAELAARVRAGEYPDNLRVV